MNTTSQTMPSAPFVARGLGELGVGVLGVAQETWLYDTLRASQRTGIAWRMLGQQVMFAHVTPPARPGAARGPAAADHSDDGNCGHRAGHASSQRHGATVPGHHPHSAGSASPPAALQRGAGSS